MEQDQVNPDAVGLEAAAPDAPVVDAAPLESDAPNWEAIVAQERAQRQALEAQLTPLQQQVQQLSQFQQQAMLAQAQAAFQREEQELLQRIEGLDDETQRRAMQEFYRQQSTREVQALQQMARTIAINGFADKLISENGLTPEDRVLLGDNPDTMPMIASALAQQRQQVAQLRTELERQRAAERAMQFVGNPATRSAGGQGAVAPQANYEPGSLAHMKAALGLP